MERPGRPRPMLALALGATLVLAGCGDEAGPRTEEPAPDRQTAFRIRGDFDVELNGDDGWAAGIDETATLAVDRPFRIRAEVEAGASTDPRRYRLEWRVDGGEWQPLRAEAFPYPQKLLELPLPIAEDGSIDPAWSILPDDATAILRVDKKNGAVLRIEAGDRAVRAAADPPVEWTPTEFKTRLRLPDDPSARLTILLVAASSEIELRVEVDRSGRLRVLRVQDEARFVLATERVSIEADRWIELTASVENATLNVEMGEVTVIEDLVIDDDLVLLPGFLVPPGSLAELEGFTIEGESATPLTSIVGSAGYTHGAPTDDLLAGSHRPFTGGAGISSVEQTPAWTPNGGHGEWEFPIVVRRFADRALMAEAGDRFEYRLVYADRQPVLARAMASVRIDVPDGHLGGTFVETPMRLGPWQADNGDLYFVMEPSETWNRMMMVKSVDGGATWREVDGEGRPATGDLEGVGTAFHDGRIHILHQVSERVVYHVFDTSDHGSSADTWTITDEPVAAPPEPPTQVADLTVHADGRVVAVYGGWSGLQLRTRSVDGQWQDEQAIEGPAGLVRSGPSIVRGRDEVSHLVYTVGDGSAHYRRINAEGQLGASRLISDDLAVGDEHVGALLPLLHDAQRDRLIVLYRAADRRLYERRLDPGGTWTAARAVSPLRVAQSPVDSDQVAADAVLAPDGRVLVLFVDEATGQLFHVAETNGRWGTAEPVVTEGPVQWVRGAVIKTVDGQPAYGFVYDGGSDGGSGKNRFDIVRLSSSRTR